MSNRRIWLSCQTVYICASRRVHSVGDFVKLVGKQVPERVDQAVARLHRRRDGTVASRVAAPPLNARSSTTDRYASKRLPEVIR